MAVIELLYVRLDGPDGLAGYDGYEREPNSRQGVLEGRARAEAAVLRQTMSELTVQQQARLLDEFASWGIFVDAKPAGYEGEQHA